MEHIAAVLLIIGCSDDMANCKELPAPTAVFETAVECETLLPGAMRRFTNDFPQLMAQCVKVDPGAEEDNAELVWNIKPDGTLFAAVEVPDVMVAEQSTGKQDRYVGPQGLADNTNLSQ